jgi:hypothetical protein
MSSLPRVIDTITGEHGCSIPHYDTGAGHLYILQDSMSIMGIVRASSWGEAYGIAEDELFPEADQTWDDIAKDLECSPESLMDDACFLEQYGFRPNGPNMSDKLNHGIFQRDLNGESLDQISESELAKRHGITIAWKDWQ